MAFQPPDNRIEIANWLNDGIIAAKHGDRERARMLLTQVVTHDERNIQGWLWLSGVVDTLEDREICLENVLSLEPQNEVARKGLAHTRQQYATTLLQQGIQASRNGDEAQASRLLQQAAERDPQNITIWEWLSKLAETPEELEDCLQRILELDPQNEMARHSLADLQVRKAAERNRPDGGIGMPSRHSESDAAWAPVPQGSVQWQELNDELLCPYCGAVKTDMEDNRCSGCKQPLWITFKSGNATGAYWTLIAFQALATLLEIVGAVALLLYSNEVVSFVMQYAPQAVPPNFAAYLKIAGVVAVFQSIFDLAVLTGLLFRWGPMFYILILGLILDIGGTVFNLIQMGDSLNFCSVIYYFVIYGFWGWLIMNAQEAFSTAKRRILLRLDRDAQPPSVALQRGKEYAQNNQWALAAVHLRHAAAGTSHELAPHLALINAYLKLKRPDLAELAYQEACRLDSKHPGLKQYAKRFKAAA